MTVRSEGQFNTVVYEDYDLYRGVDRRDVILRIPTIFSDSVWNRTSVCGFAVRQGRWTILSCGRFPTSAPATH